MKYISIPIVLISFLFGIIFIYLSKPELQIIKITPNPDNIEDNLYKDKAGTCFRYTSNEVPCTKKSNFFSIQN
jgi:hypothetical protein